MLAAAERTKTRAETYLGVVDVMKARNLSTKGPNLLLDGQLCHVSKAKPKKR